MEFDKEWAEKKARWKLESTAILACKEINPDNPLAAAESISDLYEVCKIMLTQELNQINPQIILLSTQARVDLLRKAITKVEGK